MVLRPIDPPSEPICDLPCNTAAGVNTVQGHIYLDKDGDGCGDGPGAGLPGASVSLRTGGMCTGSASFQTISSTTTDANGFYQFEVSCTEQGPFTVAFPGVSGFSAFSPIPICEEFGSDVVNTSECFDLDLCSTCLLYTSPSPRD